MGLIHFDNIQPGMITTKEVKNDNGVVLLGPNTEISERHLRIFRMWGITEVEVQDVENDDIVNETMDTLDSNFLKELEDQTQYLFRHTNLQHPAIKELYNLYKLSIVRKKSKETHSE